MRYVELNKKDIYKFIDHLKKKHRVVAPIKKENQFVFSPIESAREVCLDYMPTILPPKKYFFPQHEKLGTFTVKEASTLEATVEVEPTILFGVHTCDIEGIECLDIVFNESPADPYFRRRKKYILIIGFECMKPCDEHAVCDVMDTNNPKAGYDIMITDAGDKYILHINSQEGEKLVENQSFFKASRDAGIIKKELLKIRGDKQKNFKPKLTAKYKEINKIFKSSYNSSLWEELGERCLSCGNCTAVCPTCYCFNIYDEMNLDMKGGERNRMWDSCQLEEFASVAGGENFRKKRSSRQRHRYYRKFDYPIKKYNKFFCVGCGRCTRNCMADISLVETLNDLTKEYENAK